MWTRGRSVAKETVNNINLIYAGEWAVIYPEGGGPGGGANLEVTLVRVNRG